MDHVIVGTILVALLAAPLSLATAQPADPASSSPVEQAISRRAGTPLSQFGYDRLPASPAAPAPLLGAVGDDYDLGIGDVLAVTLRGRRDADLRVTVDSAGMLVVGGLRAVPAAGRTLGDVRTAVSAEVRARLTDTDATIALAEARQITVAVLGEVAAPGRRTVAAFSGPLDAIGAAGGILKTGSLRRVTLVRAGVPTTIDLYGVLDGSGDGDAMRLRDGDRIVVPPLGPVAAVAGAVDRPGIFELAGAPTTLGDLAGRAGAPPGTRRQRWTRLTTDADGQERVEEVEDPSAPVARDDILFITARDDRVQDRITVTGHVRDPGPRSRAVMGTLGALVRTLTFLPDPYLPFAAVQRTDPVTRRRTLVPVDLAAAIEGRGDVALQDDDRLIVLGPADVEFLSTRTVLALFGDRPAAEADGHCAGLAALARQIAADDRGPLAAGPVARAARDLRPADRPCPALYDEVPDLLPLAMRHAVLLRQGADQPGLRPVLPGSAGAPRPGTIVDRPVPAVALDGAVRAPGVRPLGTGATLRDLIGDPGELTRDVYPLLGVVERIDRTTGARRTLTFVPRSVVEGREDIVLADGDSVLVLADGFVRAMAEAGPGETVPPWLRERWVTVDGAVARPGRLAVGGPATIASLVEAAGGPTPDARTDIVQIVAHDGVRIVDLAAVPRLSVGPGAAIRLAVRDTTVWPAAVSVEGAVARPGRYDLHRGDRVADLVDRAGGPIATADPRGLVLVRPPSPDRADGETARRVQVGGPADGDGAGPSTPVEAGDRIVMPVRRSVVTVEGAVHAPVAVPHVDGRSAAAYVAEAGGPTRFADPGAIRVVLPDGRSRPATMADSDAVPPGATIVVPRDPRVPDVPAAARLLDAILARIGRVGGDRETAP